MADEKSSPEEFRSFIRELGVRAFDQLAARFAAASDAAAEQSDRATRRSASLARLAGYWSGMQPGEKAQFFEQMIVAAQSVAATAPSLAGIGRLRKKKRGLPQEVRNSFSVDLDIDEGPVIEMTAPDDDTGKRKKKEEKERQALDGRRRSRQRQEGKRKHKS